MAKEYFVVLDRGDKIQITGARRFPEKYELRDKDGYMDVSSSHYKKLFDFVQEKLEKNNVYFPKNYDGLLTVEDLIVEKLDALSSEKEKKKNEGRKLITSRIHISSVFDAVEFILANNFLMERGYIITNNNRTEKYLEIVETGDEELLEMLEIYLETRDSLYISFSWNRLYKNFERDMERASNLKEVENVWKEFVASLY